MVRLSRQSCSPDMSTPVFLQHTRSTRGASKQRRDQINVEIHRLRDLLPLSESIKDRLFQLQVMSLACIYIRKNRYKPLLLSGVPPVETPPRWDICRALRSFLLLVTREGKMLYLSENASEFLGHSVEEIMCQGDSIYDLLDSRDHPAVRAELASLPSVDSHPPTERAFICRVNLNRTAKRQMHYHKFILVHGRSQLPVLGDTVFSASCTPLLNPENAESMAIGNTTIFTSQHGMDLRFREADSICLYHLGMSKTEIVQKGLYDIVHPSFVSQMEQKHRLLVEDKEPSVMFLLRVISASGDLLWMHTVLVKNEYPPDVPEGIEKRKHPITATYQLLSDIEAVSLEASQWVYTIRLSHSFDSSPLPDRPLSPASSFDITDIKSEPSFLAIPDLTTSAVYPLGCNQIKVEIPSKPPSIPSSSLFSPEHSSPESSSSFMEMAYPVIAHPLPELGGQLDDFFKQVELSSCPSESSSTLSPPSLPPDSFHPPDPSSIHPPHLFKFFYTSDIFPPTTNNAFVPRFTYTTGYPAIDSLYNRERMGSWAGGIS